MSATWRDVTTGLANTGIAPPAATQVGDRVIAACSGYNVVWSPPDGSWAEIGSLDAAFGVLTLFTKVVDAGDLAGTWTFTYTGGSFGGSPDYNAISIDAFYDEAGVLSSGFVSYLVGGPIPFPAVAVVAGGIFYGAYAWGRDDASSPGMNSPVVETGVLTNLNHVWVMSGWAGPLTGSEDTSTYSGSLGTSANYIIAAGVVLSPASVSAALAWGAVF